MYKKNLSFCSELDVSFVPNFMAYLHFPRSSSSVNEKSYERSLSFGVNKTTLSIWSPEGIPYGVFPRRILAFIVQEAVKTRNRCIQLGSSRSEFLRLIGSESRGGKRGTSKPLQEQLKRLISSTICVISENEKAWEMEKTNISTRATLLWEEGQSLKEKTKWKGELWLSEEFYQDIIKNPIPIDFNVINSLQGAMSIDIYCWLTWKKFIVKQQNRKEFLISWERLFEQFSGGFKNDSVGKKDFKRTFLKNIKLPSKYSEINFKKSEKCLLFKVSC